LHVPLQVPFAISPKERWHPNDWERRGAIQAAPLDPAPADDQRSQFVRC
jgi:hypothetical protein